MLQSLELAGFKSFADRTRFEFPAGVTVVVGPNGSGKSNVVDAIKWVLGSQSPRSLRGKEMTDVIFNGAVGRKALGAAEATLAFANLAPPDGGRRLFDLDEDEVRLTRRVYRSGEGEYLINGRPCRLRDFRELLAGTGLGADSYCVIEQGRVDAALQATPEERRLLFEEAAGISRFRIKRREAAKRLERVEQNLARLSDIVGEVESRLKRVRAQAGRAKDYRESSARLRVVRTELALAEWGELGAEQARLEALREEAKGRLAAARAELAEAQQQLDRLGGEASGATPAERSLREADARLAALNERRARDDAAAQSERRRVAELAGETLRAAGRLATARSQRRAEAARSAAPALVAAENAERECAAALAAATIRAEQAAQRLDTLRAEHAAEKQARDARRAEVSQLRAEQERLGERVAATEHALAEIEARSAAAEASHRKASAGHAAAEADRAAAAERLAALEAAHRDTRERLAELRRALATRQREVAAAEQQAIADSHRLEALAEAQRRLEALNRDVSTLVASSRGVSGRSVEVFGLVADLVHVEVDFAPMIEAALGPATSLIVVDSGRELIDSLAAAERPPSTRASFLRLDAAPVAAAVDRVDLSDEPGVIGRAGDFVETDPRFAGVVWRLLGRTWFVDTLATAMRLAGGPGRGLSFVTQACELVGADGTVVVGPREDLEGALTRRRRAGELAEQLEQNRRTLADARRDAEALDGLAAEGERGLAELAEALDQHRKRLGEAVRRAAGLEERVRQAQQSVEEQQLARAQRSETLAELRRMLQTVTGDRARAEAEELDATAAVRLGKAVAEAESLVAAERARQAELRAAARRHAQLVASLRAERDAQAPAERGADSVDAASDEFVSIRRRLEEAELAVLSAESRAALVAIDQQLWRRRRGEAEAEAHAAGAARREVARMLAALREEVEMLIDAAAQVEPRLQQTLAQRRTLAERMRDEHQVDLAEVSAKRPRNPEEPPIDRDALRREADRLRQTLSSIGPVNLESLGELEELETRYADLAGQLGDLRDAKAGLVRLTNRINADSRELFLAGFEAIRGHFRGLFGRLFGGGEADLVLTPGGEGAGDDPLEGGVDIVACPPGKELRSLALLSGGEKTLTCVALLMALFRSKPSPFCVLDEVDAALDEANVGRYTALVTEFATTTQFLVVTHSKRTMVGADTLYGVTMQQSGVSTRVAVRFEDVSDDGHVRARASEDQTAADGADRARRAA